MLVIELVELALARLPEEQHEPFVLEARAIGVS